MSSYTYIVFRSDKPLSPYVFVESNLPLSEVQWHLHELGDRIDGTCDTVTWNVNPAGPLSETISLRNYLERRRRFND